jgi:hypothetical protein
MNLLDARSAVNRHFQSTPSTSMTLLGHVPSLLASALRTLLSSGIAAALVYGVGSDADLAVALECIAQVEVIDFVLKSDSALSAALQETMQLVLRAEATADACARNPDTVCAPLCRIVLRMAARANAVTGNGELAEFCVARLAADAQACMLRQAIVMGQSKFVAAVIELSAASAVRRTLIAGELQRALSCSFSKKAAVALPADSEARRRMLELFAAVGAPAQLVDLFRLAVGALISAERAAEKVGRDAIGDAAERALDFATSIFSMMPLAAQLVSFDAVRKQLVFNGAVDADDQEGAVTRAILRCSDAIRGTCSPEFKFALFRVVSTN